MTSAKNANRTSKSALVRQAKGIARLRRGCEDSLLGANKTDRRFLKKSISLLDHVTSLYVELDSAVDGMRALAMQKRGLRSTRSSRSGR